MKQRTVSNSLISVGVAAVLSTLALPAMAELPSYQAKPVCPYGSYPRGLNEVGDVICFVGDASSSLSGHGFVSLYASETLIDLGNLGGGSGVPNDINETGQIVGFSGTTAGRVHPFLYANGGMQDLGTLTGPDGQGQAWAINAFGQITGHTYGVDSINQAFIYMNDELVALGTLGGAESYGFCINDHGQVAGISSTSNGEMHAFVYRDESLVDLGTLGGTFSVPRALNNRGDVVGSSSIQGDVFRHAFLYSQGQMSDIVPSSTDSEAVDINDAGQVVGRASLLVSGNYVTRAFLFTNGTFIDITGSQFQTGAATDINEQGQITGVAYPHGGGWARAFIYQDGVTKDLADLYLAPTEGFHVDNLLQRRFINNRGQLAMTGCESPTGPCQSYLFTPVSVLIADLLTDSTGVGPDRKLSKQVTLAATYYDADDLQATCSQFTDFNSQVQKLPIKRASQSVKDDLIGQSTAIMDAVGCP